MNEATKLASGDRLSGPVFISYATSDRKEAVAVCEAIERRGIACWIASRDVKPGENYQEAIVRAIRSAGALVLVFSDAANDSDEIKKELSLVSRYRIPLIALRIEDVEPTDAFAYELSTRQWIDAFEGWDKSLDALVHRIEQVAAGTAGENTRSVAPPSRRARPSHPIWKRAPLLVAASLALLVMAGVGAWLLLRPDAAAATAMQVRLAGFSRLSPDLPATMPEAMRDEIIAAFGDQGTVGVSTADGPPPGTAPAYALGGTIRRDGEDIRVIARLTNERSGTTLWSNSFSYDASSLDRIPRRIAVDAGNLTRCGLFGASTYRKPLPDAVLRDYLQFCHNAGWVEWEATKSLDFARKVVAAAPDFSWGWSAVEIGSIRAMTDSSGPAAEALRNEGLDAAATAIRLDPSNSEAFAYKSYLIDQHNLSGREALHKQALKARPLACGCEHHLYAAFLEEVGRNQDAIGEYRRSVDVLALNPRSQLGLHGTLLIAGRSEEAKKHFDAAVDLSGRDPSARANQTLFAAAMMGDSRAGQRALSDPALQLPAALKSAIGAAFAALQSNLPQAKSSAAAGLLALPPEMGPAMKIYLLAALGENVESLKMVEAAVAANRPHARSLLFTPALAGARADPAFPGVAERLGLLKYWRAIRTKPDFCSELDAPPICRLI